MAFDHKSIEKKWQDTWDNQETFKTDMNSSKEKFYVLDMFPYPSGSGLHVGHPEGYTATDIVARMKRQQGFEVLHPMGWDAFGLPAEQYALKTGNSPKEFTNQNIDNFRKQLKSLGFSFDWSREVNTTDPKFYKTTQWIFAQMYKNGLAEIAEIEVNWSPSLNTVLANEEVIEDEQGNKVSERDGKPVEKKMMKQWVLKITKYADKLFNGLDKLDWPDSVKKLQKNWIYNRDDNGNHLIGDLHLNDWVFARQRYWGEPFPIVHQQNGEIYLIPEENYPVKLPEISDYSFNQDGKPALSKATDWIEYNEGSIVGTRDLNTMPQWAGSCWYYIAFVLKEGDDFLEIDSEEAKQRLNKWLPVDLYIGGQEHAVLHLMYARFWFLFLKDIGIVDKEEPFQKLFNQGMILGPDGSKMSKSKGNVVNPDEIVEQFGADSLRVYEMFMGALDDDKPWSVDGISASRAWLNRVWRYFESNEIANESSDNVKRAYNKMLSNVEKYYDELKFNLAISEMMVFINTIYKDPTLDKNLAKGFITILSCIAPHIAEEINNKFLGSDELISNATWPSLVEVEQLKADRIVMLQVNGKIRGKLINPDLSDNPSEEEMFKIAKETSPKFVNDDNFIKAIFIKGSLISIATKKEEE